MDSGSDRLTAGEADFHPGCGGAWVPREARRGRACGRCGLLEPVFEVAVRVPGEGWAAIPLDKLAQLILEHFLLDVERNVR